MKKTSKIDTHKNEHQRFTYFDDSLHLWAKKKKKNSPTNMI